MGLFEKAAIFTDIHFGLRNDSEQHNQDCLEFVEWFADQTVKNSCDTIIFMGDWFHNRVRTEVRTGYYAKLAIDMIGSLGLPVWWLLGNHDIYMKNDREIHSLMHLPKYSNIKLVEKVTQIEDVLFSPWLVSDEHDIILSANCKYIFGHFELPFFLMNQVVEKVYDGHGLHIDDFANCEAVYSGHFHKRQVRINKHKVPIHYIGNCFGHDFNDVNDHERGMAILEYGQILPTYVEWPNAPTFDRYDISKFIQLLEEDQPIHHKSTIELMDDMDLPADTSNELREAVEARNVKVRRPKKELNQEGADPTEAQMFGSLDERIEHKLRTMSYDGKFDPELLVHLYNMV
jgi:DNA repair exonuclease SbcCD nuclease subunit